MIKKQKRVARTLATQKKERVCLPIDYDSVPTIKNQGQISGLDILASDIPGPIADRLITAPQKTKAVVTSEHNGNWLYQINPYLGTKDDKPSFTFSLHSHHKASRNLANEIIENHKHNPVRWYAVVRVDDMFNGEQHKALGTKVSNRLRKKGIKALFIREVTETNHLEHNCLICNQWTKEQVKEALTGAFRDAKTNTKIKPVTNIVDLANYVTKSSVKGEHNGKWTADKYKDKRRLFTRHCGLDKHASINNFWHDRKSIKAKTKGNRKKHFDKEERTRALIEDATIEEKEQATHLARLTGEKLKTILANMVNNRHE